MHTGLGRKVTADGKLQLGYHHIVKQPGHASKELTALARMPFAKGSFVWYNGNMLGLIAGNSLVNAQGTKLVIAVKLWNGDTCTQIASGEPERR